MKQTETIVIQSQSLIIIRLICLLGTNHLVLIIHIGFVLNQLGLISSHHYEKNFGILVIYRCMRSVIEQHILNIEMHQFNKNRIKK